MYTIYVALFLIIYAIVSLPLYAYEYFLGKKDPRKKVASSQKIVVRAFKMILGGCRIKVEARGLENIPKDTPVLYAANHRSDMDILIGYTTVPTLTGFVAKKELRKVPCISRWMRYLNCVFLDRENPREGLKAILQGVDNIKNGYSMFIMPEGTRNHEKEMLPFKEGSLKMAEKTGCPIIPVAITGSDDLLEKQSPWIRPGKAIITYGKPVYVSELSKEERKQLTPMVQQIIKEMLDNQENPM